MLETEGSNKMPFVCLSLRQKTFLTQKSQMIASENSRYIPVLYYFIPMILVTVVITIVLSAIGKAEWWKHKAFGYSEGGSEYCETKEFDQYLIEDANALSNLGFIFLGEFICSIFFADVFHGNNNANKLQQNEHNVIIQYPVWTLIYGMTMIYVGVASYLFHGALTWNTHTLDVASIYAAFLFFYGIVIMNYIYCLNIKYVKYIGNMACKLKVVNYMMMLMLLILDILSIIYREPLTPLPVIGTFIYISLPLILVMIIVWLIMFWKYLKTNYLCMKLLIMSVLLLFGGFLIRQLDPIICFPDSFFQIHALFHVLLAFGLTFAYFLWRSQTVVIDCQIANSYKPTTSQNHEMVDMTLDIT